jgi:hypothetical protein
MSHTVFGRLTRFTQTPGRDPREDQMTEGLAACLEAAPDAGRALVHELFGISPRGEVSVETQQVTRGYGTTDLEIELGHGPSSVHVLFEVKVDSPASAEQGIRYMNLLRARGGESHFAWLLRVGRDVAGTLPDPAQICTWQQVATALNNWLRRQDDALYGPALVKQYIQHLEDEQLASTHGFTKDHALAVNHYESAKAALAGVLDQARARILQEWRVIDGPSQEWFARGAPWWFWQHLEKRSTSGSTDWYEPAFLQWQCSLDSLRAPEQRQREFAIGAGVVFFAGRQPLPGRDDEWLERRYDESFEYARGDPWPRILKWLPLREIAEKPGFEEQVDRVVDHVQGALELLVADPPPESAQEPPPTEQPPE